MNHALWVENQATSAVLRRIAGALMRIQQLVRAVITSATFLGTLLILQAASAMSQGLAKDLGPQPLADALEIFAADTGLQVVYHSEIATGLKSQGAQAGLSAEETLRQLLRETGLAFEFLNDRTIAIRSAATAPGTDSSGTPPAPQVFNNSDTSNSGTAKKTGFWGRFRLAQNEPSSSSQTDSSSSRREGPSQSSDKNSESRVLDEVVVTGTNIKGVAPAGSPIVVIDEQTIRRSGYTSAEQLIQSLPQNVRSGAEGATADALHSSGSLAGLNLTYGSGANLRGLGSGATLTLINGQRIAASSSGTYTDISLIPINAIERIEILTDGASAIYGADAVAGVINIVLKKNYDGSETRARYGFTAPSGRDEVRLSQTLGGDWNSGNALAVLDYLKQTELSVDERDFTSDIPSPTTIYPGNEQFAVVLSGTQKVGDKWSAGAGAQYAHVKRSVEWNLGGGLIYESPVEIDRSSGSLSLLFSPSSSWDISLDGLISQEDIDFTELYLTAGTPDTDLSSVQNQVQKQWSTGLKATGRLFDVPAGDVRIAFGVDHRSEDYERTATSLAGSRDREHAQREVDSAFAEIHVPLFGEGNRRAGLQRLELSIAGRYDDYSDFGDTTNPKIGISWMPVSSLELRSSYSTSFRAPSTGRILSNSISGTGRAVPIFSFATADGTGTLPVAALTGSRNLLAEESKNWTAGFTYRPEAIAGFQIELTYYDISYTNRIVTPPFDRTALSNPALQSFLTSFSNPAEFQSSVQQLTGRAPIYVDVTGGAFGPNPQNVTTYLYDRRLTNAGVVNTNGLDLTIDYTVSWMEGTLNLALNANHIAKIDTILVPGVPTLDIVDTTGNPVGWRVRTTAAYARGGWDAALGVNYTDKYEDTTGLVISDVDAYITVDANLRYALQVPSSGALDNVSFALSVTNLFDESPPFVQSSGLGGHYDSANADPLGRLIALEIAKRW